MEDNNKLFDILNDELLEQIEYNENDEHFENGYVSWKNLIIVLNRFRTPIGHDSDCGLHNEPAERNTECTCKITELNAT
jgi:hypothetical protein